MSAWRDANEKKEKHDRTSQKRTLCQGYDYSSELFPLTYIWNNWEAGGQLTAAIFVMTLSLTTSSPSYALFQREWREKEKLREEKSAWNRSFFSRVFRYLRARQTKRRENIPEPPFLLVSWGRQHFNTSSTGDENRVQHAPSNLVSRVPRGCSILCSTVPIDKSSCRSSNFQCSVTPVLRCLLLSFFIKSAPARVNE